MSSGFPGDGSGADSSPRDNDDGAAPSEPRALEVTRTQGATLLDPCARWERVESTPPSLPMWVRTTMPMHLDPTDWGAGFLAVHERELPNELLADLHNNVPQAVLRDLFRPVMHFRTSVEPVEGTQAIGRWKEAAAEFRAARARDPLPVVAPGGDWVREAQARQAALRNAEWQPALPDDAPRRLPLPHFTEGGAPDPEEG